MNIDLSSFSHLSAAEKFQLAQALWDDVASNPNDVPIPDWHLDELDAREAEYARNPTPNVSWEEVKRRTRARYGR